MPKTKNIFNLSKNYFYNAHKNSDFKRAKDSWRATTWVVEASSLEGYPKLVAIIIASHYNKAKGYAYISHETLHREAGVSNATINRAIRSIKLSGEWIVISGRKDWDRSGQKKGHTANKYVPLAPRAKDRSTYGGKWISWLKIEIENKMEAKTKGPKNSNRFKYYSAEDEVEYLAYYKEYVSDHDRLTMWFRGGKKDPDKLDIYSKSVDEINPL